MINKSPDPLSTLVATSSPLAISVFILLVHSQPASHGRSEHPLPNLTTNLAFRVILPGLHSNTAIEPILSYLLHITTRPSSSSIPISDTIAPSLIDALSPIASLHPSPLTRHIAFTLLSTLIISIQDPALQLSILVELVQDSPWEQLRSASIGILRLAVLKALGNKLGGASLMASPGMLHAVSSSVFKIDDEGALMEGVAALEPSRLVEGLNFYHVLLRADTLNLVRLSRSFVLFICLTREAGNRRVFGH